MKFKAVRIHVDRESVIRIYKMAEENGSFVDAVKTLMRLGEPHLRLSIESSKVGVHYILDNFSWLLDDPEQEMVEITIRHAIHYKFLEETEQQ